jgi:hypothetical protein
MTAPITAKVMAIFNPTKMCGMAVGNRILMNVCVWLADNERIRSISDAGTAVSPVAVATTIGKKRNQEHDDDFRQRAEADPERKQRAIATLGIDWNASRMG